MTLRKRAAHRQFGFVIGPSRLEHHRAAVARFTCRCGAEAEVKPREPLNPEDVAKRFERDFGWKADGFRASVTRCAACLAKKEPGESPGKKPHQESAPPMAANPATPIRPTPTAVPRELTPAERRKVRTMLDGNFDDDAGCYLEGWSDQRIGAECNVPWAAVALIRESSYGKIRVDPEVAGLRAEIADLNRKVKDVEAAAATALAELTRKAADMTARLEKLAGKRAA